jgi:hypothetical protein
VTRYVARVKQIRRRVQFIGLPPSLSGDPNSTAEKPDPKWLVIELSPDGWFLYRYTSSGQVAGDTWHASLEDAQYQANREYESEAREWVEVPSSIGNAVKFAEDHLELRSS